MDKQFNVPRSKEDYLEIMRYYYQSYVNRQGFVYNGHWGRSERSIYELRAHARGLQSVQQYQDIVNPIVSRTENGRIVKKRQKMNISWQPYNFLYQQRNKIKDHFDKLILNPSTHAYNKRAEEARMTQKNLLKLQVMPEMKAFTQGSYDMPENKLGVETPDDVEFLFQMGGIQLPIEIEMKDVIDAVINYSDFDVIKGMLAEDIIDLNAAACDVIQVHGQDRLAYVDWAKVIVGSSIYPDFRDRHERGYISYKPVKQILSEAPELTPDEKKQIMGMPASAYYHHNNVFGDGRRENFARSTTTTQYGLEVMKMYFFVFEEERYLKGTEKNGSRIFMPVDEKFKIRPGHEKQGKTVESYLLPYLYQCNWIVNTNIIYGAKPVPQARSEDRLIFPMALYCGHEPSLIESCVASDNDLQVGVLKLRNVMRKLAPGPRMIIDKSKIKDFIKIGQEEFSLTEMMGMYQTEGMLIVETREDYALPNEEFKGSKSPFEFLPSGIVEDVQILRSEIREAMNDIINQIGRPDVIQEAQKVQYASQSFIGGVIKSGDSALTPATGLYVKTIRHLYRYIGRKYQAEVLSGDVLLRAGTRTVKLSGDAWQYDFDIDISVQSMEFIQLLFSDLAAKKDLVPSQAYFEIMNAIKDGDEKKAQFLMAKYTEKAIAQQKQNEIDLQTATSEANAAAAERAEAAKQQTARLLTEETIKLEERKHGLTKDLNEAGHKQKLEQIEKQMTMQGENQMEVTKANNISRLTQ